MSAKVPLFTAENAAEMARRSHMPGSKRLTPVEPAEPIPQPAKDDYEGRRLARVREQLDRVDEAILDEATKDDADGQRLNWLASAQERLAEQERILAGRPLPGSRRPAPEKPPGRPSAAVPIIPPAS